MASEWQPPIQVSGNNDNYYVSNIISSGGSGAVFRGLDTSGRSVAIKFFTSDGPSRRQGLITRLSSETEPTTTKLSQSAAAKDYKNEIQLLGSLIHPSIPKLIDTCSGPSNKPFAIIMEHIEGREFNKWLADCKGWSELKKVLQQIIVILSYLEDSDVVHFDIKSSNILINNSDHQVYLIDFALAMKLSPDVKKKQNILIPPGRLEPLSEEMRDGLKPYQQHLHTVAEIRSAVFPWFDKVSVGHLLSSQIEPLIRCCGVKRSRRFRQLVEEIRDNKIIGCKEILEALDDLDPQPTLFPYIDFHQCRTTQVCGDSVTLIPAAEMVLGTPEFSRLHFVKQLSMIDLIYRGATHTRWLHSVDTYRHSLQLMESLMQKADRGFLDIWSPQLGTLVALCSLMHDINHVHFMHVLQEENLWKKGWTKGFVQKLLKGTFPLKGAGEAQETLESILVRHGISAELFASIVYKGEYISDDNFTRDQQSFVTSLLNSGADIDKVSYLTLDSHFTGVKYGNSVDINHLYKGATVVKVNEDSCVLAYHYGSIAALEALIYARYWNFRTIYWHHTHRAYMSMLLAVIRRVFSNSAQLYKFLEQTLYVDQREMLSRLDSLYVKKFKVDSSPITNLELDRSKLYRRLITLYPDRLDEEKLILRCREHKFLGKDFIPVEEALVKILNESELLNFAGSLIQDDILIDLPGRSISEPEPIWVVGARGEVGELRKFSKPAYHLQTKVTNLSSTLRVFINPKKAPEGWCKESRNEYRVTLLSCLKTAINIGLGLDESE